MNDELNKFLSTADPLCAEHDSIVDELDLMTTDRDIKAANLQLLVEKVLAAVPCIDDVADCVELRELEELARSLKQ